jgi:hypothetical protein
MSNHSFKRLLLHLFIGTLVLAALTKAMTWDSEGQQVRRQSSEFMADPPHQFWKRDGSVPVEDKVVKKFFFRPTIAMPQPTGLKSPIRCGAQGPSFVFEHVFVRTK